MSIGDFAFTRSPVMLRLCTCFYSTGYLLLAGACLIRWHTPDPWARLDLFSGGYLLLRAVGSLHSLVTGQGAFRNPQVRQEWWATNSEPGGIRRVMVLMALDLTVLVDYAHGHLWGLLEQPFLRACGLAIYAAAMVWQMWTDSYLARFFAAGWQPAPLMNDGPYRFVRHPRYAASLAGKIAFALVFSNALGWLMVLTWGALLLRKVEAEETHLRRLFGQSYETYQHATAKLLPGVY